MVEGYITFSYWVQRHHCFDFDLIEKTAKAFGIKARCFSDGMQRQISFEFGKDKRRKARMLKCLQSATGAVETKHNTCEDLPQREKCPWAY